MTPTTPAVERSTQEAADTEVPALDAATPPPLPASGDRHGSTSKTNITAPAILFAEGAPSLIIQTGTRVDTGSWFGKSRLWVGVCGDILRVAAEGRRPYLERVARRDLGASCYCHVTGALLLAPAHGVRAHALRLSPLEGRQLLHWIHGKDTHDA